MPGQLTQPPGSNPPPAGWTPEFEGQRPPFGAGNTLSTTHGAYSPRRTDPIAHAFIEELGNSDATSYLLAPQFKAAVWSWASAQAKVQVLTEWVDGMAIEDAASSVRGQTSPLELLRKWMATSQTWASRLGLDPLSAARLGKDVAQGKQADIAGELTRMRLQHEESLRQTPPGG